MAALIFSMTGRSRAYKALAESVKRAKKSAEKEQTAANAESSAQKSEDKPAEDMTATPPSLPNALRRLRAELRGKTLPEENEKEIFLPEKAKRFSAEKKLEGAPCNDPCDAVCGEPCKDSGDKTPSLYPVSAAKEKEKARKTLAHEIGTAVEGKGVYLGLKEIKDHENGLVGLFDFYAAPEDLKKTNVLGQTKQLTLKFHKAVSYVAKLKNWHGHNGFNHSRPQTDADVVLYNAMREGRYKGEWFIPPVTILREIYKNKTKGAFNESFVTRSRRNSEAHWYLSCSENKSEDVISTLRMGDGHETVDKVPYPQSVRCVRAEPR